MRGVFLTFLCILMALSDEIPSKSSDPQPANPVEQTSETPKIPPSQPPSDPQSNSGGPPLQDKAPEVRAAPASPKADTEAGQREEKKSNVPPAETYQPPKKPEEPAQKQASTERTAKDEEKSETKGDARGSNIQGGDKRAEGQSSMPEEEGQEDFDEHTCYYDVLGVKEDSSSNEIRKAYREKALRYHPDRHVSQDDEKNKKNEKNFRMVAEAYQVLSDEEKRKQYDQVKDPTKYKSGNGPGGPPPEFFSDPMELFREILKDNMIPGPMGQMIGEILDAASRGQAPPGFEARFEGPGFEGRAGGRLKAKHINIMMGGPGPFGGPGGPFGFPGFPFPGGVPGESGEPGAPRVRMHMERIMRDKDGHVFKVVEEKVLGGDGAPGGTGGQGPHIVMGPGAELDPIKALKKLQRLHEMQEKQYDELFSMLFLLFFLAMLLSAYRRQRPVDAEIETIELQQMQLRALAAAQARARRMAPSEAERTRTQKSARQFPPARNGVRGKNVVGNGNMDTVRASAKRVVGKGLNAMAGAASEVKQRVTDTASGMKQRAVASYRKAVKRGKKD
ncbi:hypothetical protein AAMO2058_000825500 [Amorphochlora amoebiformis]